MDEVIEIWPPQYQFVEKDEKLYNVFRSKFRINKLMTTRFEPRPYIVTPINPSTNVNVSTVIQELRTNVTF